MDAETNETACTIFGDANHELESRMTAANHPLSDAQSMNRPRTEALYEIRVKGRLDPSWSDWLGGLEFTSQTDDETLLTGSIVDQAALHGILDKLYALNLSLLSVVQVRNDQQIEGSQNA